MRFFGGKAPILARALGAGQENFRSLHQISIKLIRDVYKRQKYEIYTIMHDLIKEGKSIIMISSEMPELLGMADRVMVMCEGRVTGFLDREEADSVSVMRLATKFM